MDPFLLNFAPDSIVIKAYLWAKEAHESIGQLRKYSKLPYIVHPLEVARILWEHGERDEKVLAAAMLHDVIEDVTPKNKANYNLCHVHDMFGMDVMIMVVDLTDVYTPEAHPEKNRKERKKLESDRIASIGNPSLRIKFGDYISNTADIGVNEPGFAREVYLPEKRVTLVKVEKRVQESGDQVLIRLYNTARSQVEP